MDSSGRGLLETPVIPGNDVLYHVRRTSQYYLGACQNDDTKDIQWLVHTGVRSTGGTRCQSAAYRLTEV